MASFSCWIFTSISCTIGLKILAYDFVLVRQRTNCAEKVETRPLRALVKLKQANMETRPLGKPQ